MNITQQTVTFAIMLGLLAGGVGTVYAAPQGKNDRTGSQLRAQQYVHPRVSAVREAVERGEYATWRQLTEGMPIGALIKTEEDFEKLTYAHSLLEDGYVEEAHTLMRELGIEKPFRGHMRGGMRLYLELDDEQTKLLEQARHAYQEGDRLRAREIVHELRESLPAHVDAKRSGGWMRTMHRVGE